MYATRPHLIFNFVNSVVGHVFQHFLHVQHLIKLHHQLFDNHGIHN